MLFGAGWALSATCPVPAIGTVTSGGVLGLLLMAGLSSASSWASGVQRDRRAGRQWA